MLANKLFGCQAMYDFNILMQSAQGLK
jgi:hypothetical protein